MYFKKLEIFGFKSFADKTVLNFEPGITAVIGPNGCGKSNIFDAIRWVLGEQSVKELRGSSMEDVIFNGTDKKAPLGFAEVSVTFSNECRTLPVEYNEVTVTRRLFRSGESEYLLNKTSVRLKDINELFMGTGIGSEAYSLVQQGRVDLVVSAKPEDRRMLIDEASGITKYKSKRREALNKLKDTENNLLRINDIITEVKRQITSLERQANKARRYKEEYEKLKGLEVQFANHELASLGGLRGELQRKLRQLQGQEQQLAEELKELNERVEHESSLLEEFEDKINEVTSDDIKLDGQIDLNHRQIEFNDERLEGIAVNEERLSEKRGQLQERCRVQQERAEEIQRALAGIDEVARGDRERLQEKKDLLGAISRDLQAAREEIQQEEAKVMGVTSSQVNVKNRLTDIMKDVQGCLARKRRLEMENIKVSQEKGQVDQRLQEIGDKMRATVGLLEELTAELMAKRDVLRSQISCRQALDNEINDLDKKRLFLRSQKEFIEKMSAQYQDIPDPVAEGRFFTDVPPKPHHTGMIGKVKDVCDVDRQQFSLLKDRFPMADRLYEVTCETKFIELDPLQISAKIEEMDGELVRKTSELDAMVVSLEEQQTAVQELDLQSQEQEKIRSIFAAQQQDVTGEASKLDEELNLVKMELDEVTGQLTEHKINEDGLIKQLDSLNQDLGFAQRKIRDCQHTVAVKSQEREETTVLIAQVEAEVASVEGKKESHLENLQTLTEALDSSRQELERIEQDFLEMRSKREQYERSNDELREKIGQLKEQKQSLTHVLEEYQQQRDEVSQRIDSVRSHMASFAQEVEQLRNDRHNEELQDQELTFKAKEIHDRLSQAYKIDLDEFNRQVAGSSENERPAAVDPEELRIMIQRLRKRCDAFGSVNLVAIEEFEELKERFEFLTKQQSDLITARESLLSTIRKINRQTRQMFLDTFTKVSEEFRIYFRMLFGGGDAQLLLSDPENVLESGIEIIARPPGKKLQNISLLSGGEKTLTAIALIFGVFKVNPSPFCVLDEIDAALDESNVGRYSYLLKDFAKIAQFIVITHNKKTIASADVMYGITMQETGVSRIVSVKFGENDKQQGTEAEVPAVV